MFGSHLFILTFRGSSQPGSIVSSHTYLMLHEECHSILTHTHWMPCEVWRNVEDGLSVICLRQITTNGVHRWTLVLKAEHRMVRKIQSSYVKSKWREATNRRYQPYQQSSMPKLVTTFCGTILIMSDWNSGCGKLGTLTSLTEQIQT
jgi:hypothetical protein